MSATTAGMHAGALVSEQPAAGQQKALPSGTAMQPAGVKAGVRPRQSKIVLFGLFGTSNLGNDATLWVTLHHLRTRLPEAEVLCVCGNLPEFAKDYGVMALALDPLPLRGMWRIGNTTLRNLYGAIATVLTEPLRRRRVFKQLAGAERLVVVGTGVLDDFGELPWRMPAWLLRWCQGARIVGASTHLLAVGAGPIRNAVNRFLMLHAVRLSDCRSYRDSFSKDYLTALGIDTRSDDVVPDLVFSLPKTWIPSYRAPSEPPKVIGVGLMGYYGWKNNKSSGKDIYDAYIRKMAQFVSWLLGKGYQVRLIIGELEIDDAAVSDLRNAVKSIDARGMLVSRSIDSVAALLGEIMHTDLVISSRYHNIVCALALSRPVLSIGYARKFDALMQDTGLAAFCQDIENLNVTSLIEQFQALVAEHAQATRRISARCDEYRDRLNILFNSTFGNPGPNTTDRSINIPSPRQR